MSPHTVALVIGIYFLVLITISWLTTGSANAASFYTGDRQSPWYLVAFGMVGATLSGVTFISLPGEVGNSNFYYFQIVLGYTAGYAVVAQVLMPLYYKLNVISIYEFLSSRLGFWSHKTGAVFFLLSRIVGASFRLFLVAATLQIGFFDAFNLPFWVSVAATVFLIWVYTLKGGIKTIVWTDILQTTFMILSLLTSIYLIQQQMEWSFSDMLTSIHDDPRSTVFNWDWKAPGNFFKQFISGVFIVIVMTGLDQDMMQKNLTCKNLKDAQKNIFWFTVILVFVNMLFLSLGIILYQFAEASSILVEGESDALFPTIAIQHLPLAGGIIFLLGITAAAYSSADSALTALTTSFCVDILGFVPENFDKKKSLRMLVHFGFSLVIFFTVLVFSGAKDQSVLNAVFSAAGYTYGPILGMFAFGMYTPWKVQDRLIPVICVVSPVLSYLLKMYSSAWLDGYQIGFEIVLINGFIVFAGMYFLRRRNT